MTGLFAVLGALLGLGVAGFAGLVGGAVTGFLLGRVAKLADQIRALREDQQWLRAQLASRSPEQTPEQTAEQTPELAPDAAFNAARVLDDQPAQDSAGEVAPPEVRATSSAFYANQPPQPVDLPNPSPAQTLDAPSGWQAPPKAQNHFAAQAYRFLTEGNVVAKIGVIVLFFGVAFLLKYAADQAIFPIQMRLALVGVGGVVLLGLGWFLRQRHTEYALIVQGGGIGVLYLTLFAAFRLYHLVPAGLTLGLMLGVVAAAAMLALVQNAKSLAILGITGGFLAPILAGSPTGSHVDLFSYYLILDLSIVLIAWRKAWRALNLIAFIFTFVVGTLWGVLRYRPEWFATTEPFLIGFYLIFLATAILFARQQMAAGQRDYVQSTLVFGPPLVGFGLQALLVQHFAYGLAWSAFLLGLLYLLLAIGLKWVQGPRYRTLNEAFLALGIGFVTLAVPFAFDGQWTATTWALEGAAMLWVGLRQNKRAPVWLGLLLQLGAGVAVGDSPPNFPATWPLVDGFFMSAVAIAGAGMICAYLLRTLQPMQWVARVLVGWSALWWYGAGLVDLLDFYDSMATVNPLILFVVFSLILLLALRVVWRDWRVLAYGPGVSLGLLWLLGVFSLLFLPRTLIGTAFWAWPLAFAVVFAGVRGFERGNNPVARAGWVLGASVWLIALLLQPQLLAWFWPDNAAGYRSFALADFSSQGAWPDLAWGFAVLLVLAWMRFAPHWPFGQKWAYWPVFRGWAAVGLMAFLMLWLLGMHFLGIENKNYGLNWAWPLTWGAWPLFNGVDGLTGLIFALLLFLLRDETLALAPATRRYGFWVLGLLAFIWLNAMLARGLAVFAGLPLGDSSFWGLATVQTTYSIAWSILGLGLIVLASRLARRWLWLAAGLLLGVVVLKLFFVDLSGSDTIARIVSFMGVGVLLLLAGYVAPIPSKKGANSP
ncbi:MAG: DUF2339 domain-containing protein [Halothiobacillaceae bacterium]|nr:DUF2339 domain-containing protein [Halothiobacillaceae bacterium]HUM99431.1 DUF2339 domain-containing protein [Halothiobacillus sp.]